MTEFSAFFVGGCFAMFAFGWAGGAIHKFFTQALDQV